MRSLLKRLDGRLSQELLARPSRLAIGQANLRIAFVLCALLCVASMIFTIFQWSLAEGIYRLQSKQAETGVQQLLISQDMMAALSNAHRFTLNALLSRDESEWRDAEKRHAASFARYSGLLDKVAQRSEPNQVPSLDRLKSEAQSYQKLSLRLMEMARSGKLEEALNLRIAELRPVFNKWQEEQIRFSNEIESREAASQAKSTRMVAVARTTLLTLLIIPVIVMVVGILATLAVLGWQHWSISKPDKDDAWIR